MRRRVAGIALAGLLAAAASVIGHLHAMSQTYTPSVKVASPDGMTYLAVLGERGALPACSAANRRFLAPMKAACPECDVVFARCTRELDGLEDALRAGRALPFPVLTAPDVRLAIVGDAPAARAACGFIAQDVRRRGLGRASCAYPEG
jgi:hypothetical protein